VSGPVRLRRWLRGVRVRLMLTYLLAAVALAAVGVGVFTIALGNGLRANADASLSARAATLTADVQAGNVEQSDSAPHIAPPRTAGAAELPAFTAVYDTAGQLVEAKPAALPAAPISQAEVLAPHTTHRSSTYAGEQFRILTQPVHRPDGIWLVVAGQNLNTVNDATAEVRRSLYLAVPIALLLVGLGAWLLSGAALKPVDRMRADAQRLSEHDAAGRISEPDTSDSLNELAQTFNPLLGRLHGSMARQRALVADAGHELRNPLAVLQTELETAIRPARSRADLVDSITHAQAEVSRLASLAEDLLLLAQVDAATALVRTQLTDVGELVSDAVVAQANQALARSVEVRAELPGHPVIADIDPIAFRRVLDNLVANAARYTPAGGRILIRVTDIERHGARALAMEVTDTGTGFPPEFLPIALDRFTRAEQSRSRSGAAGTGLGLAIVDTLVRAHGGTVTASNVPSGGAQVALHLPLQQPERVTADCHRVPSA
jgi:two-component system OmpR family sensor kinase